jgi:cytochrome c oxidase subunit 2
VSDGIALWPSAASTTAESVDRLFFFLTAVCGAVAVLVFLLLAYFCARYGKRDGDEAARTDVRPSAALEWFWTLTPLGIFMVMFWWGGKVYLEAFSPPRDSLTVFCLGKQWMWKFQHLTGQYEISTLHVPVGRPVRLLLTSEDVIHSFFVPDFRVHMDVVPGRYTTVWFQATRTGSFDLYCSQYCGTNHSRMIGKVVVLESQAYEDWTRLQADGSLADQGHRLFLKYRCLSCHTADASARAPVLENVFGHSVALQEGRLALADYGYIRKSILDPSADIVAGFRDVMPPFEGQINEEEIIALAAYIKSLGRGDTPLRVEESPPPVKPPKAGADAEGSRP